MQEIYNELINKIEEQRVFLNEPMSKHTTFKIGGNADLFVKVNTLEELKETLQIATSNNLPITVIGNGSNVLVKDGGIRGIVIKLNFDKILIENEKVAVGAGTLLSKLTNKLLENELSGLEFACGIPGNLGGAIRMNAGAYGKEIAQSILDVTYLDTKDLKTYKISNKDCNFSYRKSRFTKEKDKIIVEATLDLVKGNKEEISKIMEQDKASRKEKQPLEFPSAGSVFKRGDGFITAELIDKCGLKGYNVGDAFVSEKHAGFIINKGNAKAKDVLDLIKIIKQKVFEKFNVNIELEIEVMGED